MDYPHKGPVMQSFSGSFVVHLISSWKKKKKSRAIEKSTSMA